MKTVLALVLIGVSHLCVSTPLPDPGLLRVPRIYNALITTDAKLQPSRASPHSVPAVPVVVPFVPADDEHHHSTDRHNHAASHPEADKKAADIPAVGKNGEKLKPESKMYPLTFYPQSVGYYPHPFLPYNSYPYNAQPFVFGQYPGGGYGGGLPAGTYSTFGGNGFGAAGGAGEFNPLAWSQGGQPVDFAVEQSSSLQINSGRRVSEVDAENVESEADSEDDVDENDEETSTDN